MEHESFNPDGPLNIVAFHSDELIAHVSRNHLTEQAPNWYGKESFSDDGGKTWEPNFVATLTREKSESTSPE